MESEGVLFAAHAHKTVDEIYHFASLISFLLLPNTKQNINKNGPQYSRLSD